MKKSILLLSMITTLKAKTGGRKRIFDANTFSRYQAGATISTNNMMFGGQADIGTWAKDKYLAALNLGIRQGNNSPSSATNTLNFIEGTVGGSFRAALSEKFGVGIGAGVTASNFARISLDNAFDTTKVLKQAFVRLEGFYERYFATLNLYGALNDDSVLIETNKKEQFYDLIDHTGISNTSFVDSGIVHNFSEVKPQNTADLSLGYLNSMYGLAFRVLASMPKGETNSSANTTWRYGVEGHIMLLKALKLSAFVYGSNKEVANQLSIADYENVSYKYGGNSENVLIRKQPDAVQTIFGVKMELVRQTKRNKNASKLMQTIALLPFYHDPNIVIDVQNVKKHETFESLPVVVVSNDKATGGSGTLASPTGYKELYKRIGNDLEKSVNVVELNDGLLNKFFRNSPSFTRGNYKIYDIAKGQFFINESLNKAIDDGDNNDLLKFIFTPDTFMGLDSSVRDFTRSFLNHQTALNIIGSNNIQQTAAQNVLNSLATVLAVDTSGYDIATPQGLVSIAEIVNSTYATVNADATAFADAVGKLFIAPTTYYDGSDIANSLSTNLLSNTTVLPKYAKVIVSENNSHFDVNDLVDLIAFNDLTTPDNTGKDALRRDYLAAFVLDNTDASWSKFKQVFRNALMETAATNAATVTTNNAFLRTTDTTDSANIIEGVKTLFNVVKAAPTDTTNYPKGFVILDSLGSTSLMKTLLLNPDKTSHDTDTKELFTKTFAGKSLYQDNLMLITNYDFNYNLDKIASITGGTTSVITEFKDNIMAFLLTDRLSGNYYAPNAAAYSQHNTYLQLSHQQLRYLIGNSFGKSVNSTTEAGLNSNNALLWLSYAQELAGRSGYTVTDTLPDFCTGTTDLNKAFRALLRIRNTTDPANVTRLTIDSTGTVNTTISEGIAYFLNNRGVTTPAPAGATVEANHADKANALTVTDYATNLATVANFQDTSNSPSLNATATALAALETNAFFANTGNQINTRTKAIIQLLAANNDLKAKYFDALIAKGDLSSTSATDARKELLGRIDNFYTIIGNRATDALQRTTSGEIISKEDAQAIIFVNAAETLIPNIGNNIQSCNNNIAIAMANASWNGLFNNFIDSSNVLNATYFETNFLTNYTGATNWNTFVTLVNGDNGTKITFA